MQAKKPKLACCVSVIPHPDGAQLPAARKYPKIIVVLNYYLFTWSNNNNNLVVEAFSLRPSQLLGYYFASIRRPHSVHLTTACACLFTQFDPISI